MKNYFLLFMGCALVFTSCNKNDDDPAIDEEVIEEEVVEQEPIEETKSRTDYPAQDFMWSAMNAFYFWQEDVNDLADDRFNSLADYAEFLSEENNPETFFYKICNNHERVVGEASAIDRFSFAIADYKDLVNGLQGISKSNGLEFQLYAFRDSNDIYGVVTYIAKDSDASTKDIKRGDVFIGVNGQTLNRDNYINLLFGSNDTYTLEMASIADNTVTENGVQVSLTKIENFVEDPILVSKVIEQSGIKIGYLMYNSFLASFDEQLNAAMGTFKSEGITELVLDFRYNGGGRVSSALQIASSVYGTNTNDLFLKARYNNKIQSTFQPGDGEINFANTTIAGSPINDLNLPRVYIITTNATASASELVMNGLAPYVRVVQIGGTTRGKNEFSRTFVDDIENSYFYNEAREANINPDNQWGIQPLLGRNENADGFSDYTSGLVPQFELSEDVSNLGILGDPSEPLLALAISKITGETGKFTFEPKMPELVISASYEFKETDKSSVMNGLLESDVQINNMSGFGGIE